MIPHISIQMHNQRFNSLMQTMIISSWSARSFNKNKASHMESLVQKKRKKESLRLRRRQQEKEKKEKKACPNLRKKRKRNSQGTS